MSLQEIGLGTVPGDKTGDPARTAGQKINANFQFLDQRVDGISTTPGPQGEEGNSAYEVAVANGFVGTEAEWLTSLVGPQGEPGADGASQDITPTVYASDSENFDGSQHGISNIYEFNGQNPQELIIDESAYTVNKVCMVQRGEQPLELKGLSGAPLGGKRNSENRTFLRGPNLHAFFRKNTNGKIIVDGNIELGYTGVVSVSSYSAIREADINVDVTVIGTGFSPNMVVTTSVQATQVTPYTYISPTEIVLHLTPNGVAGDHILITYDNGDIIEDSLIISQQDNSLFSTHPFDVGYALFKLKTTQEYGVRIRRSNDNTEVDVGFDNNDKISLASPVSSGGILSDWIGSNDAFVTTRYNQGSLNGFHQVQSDSNKQPKIISSGIIINQGGWDMMEHDGVDDYFDTDNNPWGATPITVFANGRLSSNQSGNFLSAYTSDNTRPFYLVYRSPATKISLITADSNGNTAVADSLNNVSLNTNYKIAAFRNDDDSAILINGVSGNVVSAPSNYDLDVTKLETGKIVSRNDNILSGFTNYSILYRSDKSADIAAIETIIDNML